MPSTRPTKERSPRGRSPRTHDILPLRLRHGPLKEARAVIVVPNTRAAWFPMIEGAGVRSVQTASQGAGSQFFKVHHQCGAEPYTFGRGGMRAVEVDFKGVV